MKTVLAVFLLAGSATVWAQSADLWFSAGESLLSTNLGADPALCTTSATCQSLGDNGKDLQFTNGFRFAFRFGFNYKSHFGGEVGYAYSRTQLKYNDVTPAFEQGMAIHQGTLNALAYATREEARFRPFVTGGVGFANYVPPGSSATYGGGSTKLGFNYGAGVKMKITGFWGARLDVRQYVTPIPFGLALASGWVHQTEVSAGVGVLF
ncbi:MAG TPA: outer membrane beta-barrel protein [Bryobacteraceae bacterium]|nr:outer membrane beta-barrel protein [Bryobacteraceae bacterium]